MKKFNFPLNTVLNYKDQVLENLRNEHGQILSEVSVQERVVKEAEFSCQKYYEAFEFQKVKGTTANRLRDYGNYLDKLRRDILAEQKKLEALKLKEAIKRGEVLHAKQEKASIEKLKERNLIQYNKDYQKSEERFIEEFVSNVNMKTKLSG